MEGRTDEKTDGSWSNFGGDVRNEVRRARLGASHVDHVCYNTISDNVTKETMFFVSPLTKASTLKNSYDDSDSHHVIMKVRI